MQQYLISRTALEDLIKRLLKTAKVTAPVNFAGRNILEEIDLANLNQVNLSGFRTVEPFKSYFFRLTEKVAGHFGAAVEPSGQTLVLLGARGCDLEALEVLDRVYLEGEFCEPFYQTNRANSLIIGADCTGCGQTCFCTMVGGQPYPTKKYDLNLAPVSGGYYVEVGTDKGARLIAEHQDLLQNGEGYKEEVDKNRDQVIKQLEETNKPFPITKEISLLHKMNLESQIWRTLTKDCVECSACNFACPTCTCFLLLDAVGEKQKVWDACLKAGYARVAGGGNSRPKLYQRLQNRYHCKFDYSNDRLDRYTCVGCGRCIDACAGNIDMRKIFLELERQAPLTAKLE